MSNSWINKGCIVNRISVLSIISFLAYACILFVYRTMGYTITSIFAQPSQFYFLVVPIVIILFVFQFVSITLHKANNKWEWIYKVSAYSFMLIVCLLAALSPWIYIQVATQLQLLLNMIVLASFVMVISMHVLIKVKSMRRA